MEMLLNGYLDIDIWIEKDFNLWILFRVMPYNPNFPKTWSEYFGFPSREQLIGEKISKLSDREFSKEIENVRKKYGYTN